MFFLVKRAGTVQPSLFLQKFPSLFLAHCRKWRVLKRSRLQSEAMKAPVGLLSDRTVLRSKMEGPRPDKFRFIELQRVYHTRQRKKTHPPMKNRAFYYCGCTWSVPCRPAGATGAEDVEVLHVCVLSALRHSYRGLSCFLMIRSGTFFDGSKGFVLFSFVVVVHPQGLEPTAYWSREQAAGSSQFMEVSSCRYF